MAGEDLTVIICVRNNVYMQTMTNSSSWSPCMGLSNNNSAERFGCVQFARACRNAMWSNLIDEAGDGYMNRA